MIEILIASLCQVESSNNHRAINPTDYGAASYGYCQVKYNTAKLVGYKGSITTLWLNKKVNKAVAARYFMKQYERYGCVEDALAAYNAGRVKKKNGQFINKQYVERVMKVWKSKLNTTNSLTLQTNCTVINFDLKNYQKLSSMQ